MFDLMSSFTRLLPRPKANGTKAQSFTADLTQTPAGRFKRKAPDLPVYLFGQPHNKSLCHSTDTSFSEPSLLFLGVRSSHLNFFNDRGQSVNLIF